MTHLIADDGARLHVTSTGSGPLTVIFLPSMGASTADWASLWAAMDQQHVRCVALDLRGAGESELEPCEISNQRLADDVLQVADHFAANSFVVVGHSIGGKTGLYLTIVAPERVKALVLLGCPSPGLVPIGREVLDDYLAHTDRRAYTETFFRPWFKVWPRPEIDAWLDGFARIPDWALLALCEAAMWTDFRDRLRPVAVPALVVVGEHDPIYGPAYQREQVLPHLAQPEVVTIDCGHGLVLERPAEIARALDLFLERF